MSPWGSRLLKKRFLSVYVCPLCKCVVTRLINDEMNKWETIWTIFVSCYHSFAYGSSSFAHQHQCKEEAQKCRWSLYHNSSVLPPWTGKLRVSPLIVLTTSPFTVNRHNRYDMASKDVIMKVYYVEASSAVQHTTALQQEEQNAWLTANSSAMPFGASSPAASRLSSWARKLLSIQAWCSMTCYTVHCLG